MIMSASRWHDIVKPHLNRKRLRLEALLGSTCSYCGLTRADGVNLQFHHHLGRDYQPRKLSWNQRLCRYEAEIKAGVLLYLACDQSGRNCHENCKRQAPSSPTKLYDYATTANQPF